MIEGIIKGVLLLGDGILTGSELQCTNVLIDYFFKEFVYKNLYVYDGKQKKERCDIGLSFFCSISACAFLKCNVRMF